MGAFALSDVKVDYHDGYIEIGATPTFLPLKMKKLLEENY